MTFGEKLKKLRSDNNLTQEQLAERIYVTRTAVSKWETGNGYPAIDSLKQLSELFGISIDSLISDEDVENKKLLDKIILPYVISRVVIFAVVLGAIVYTLISLK